MLQAALANQVKHACIVARISRNAPVARTTAPSSSTTARDALEATAWHMPTCLIERRTMAAEPLATDSLNCLVAGVCAPASLEPSAAAPCSAMASRSDRPCVRKPSRTSSMRALSTVSYLRAASCKSSSSAAARRFVRSSSDISCVVACSSESSSMVSSSAASMVRRFMLFYWCPMLQLFDK